MSSCPPILRQGQAANVVPTQRLSRWSARSVVPRGLGAVTRATQRLKVAHCVVARIAIAMINIGRDAHAANALAHRMRGKHDATQLLPAARVV